MQDVLVYCPDTDLLTSALEADYPDYIFTDPDTGATTYLVNKTPTIRNGLKTVALVRVDATEASVLADLENNHGAIVRLGGHAGGDPYAEMDTDTQALYDSVHTRPIVPILDTLGNDTGKTYQAPIEIGRFA